MGGGGGDKKFMSIIHYIRAIFFFFYRYAFTLGYKTYRSLPTGSFILASLTSLKKGKQNNITQFTVRKYLLNLKINISFFHSRKFINNSINIVY